MFWVRKHGGHGKAFIQKVREPKLFSNGPFLPTKHLLIHWSIMSWSGQKEGGGGGGGFLSKQLCTIFHTVPLQHCSGDTSIWQPPIDVLTVQYNDRRTRGRCMWNPYEYYIIYYVAHSTLNSLKCLHFQMGSFHYKLTVSAWATLSR